MLLRFESLTGQPWLMSLSTVLPGSKSSCTTVSLTWSPCCSMSNATFERRSPAARVMVSPLSPATVASSGVNVWNVNASLR